MADLKISQLPVATTPLAGTELVPIVQGGVTDQTTVQAILTGTVPSGTANGVLYLNGSKVVTSGSALTFDGIDLAIGNAGGLALFKRASDGLSVGRVGSRSSTDISVYNAGGVTAEFVAGANELRFNVAATEQMRLTSTGLGIGTSSPSAKLHVVGSTYRQNSVTGSFGFTINTTSATTTLATLFGGSSFAIQTAASGTNQLLLDSSGNLGLGVTPSAWWSGSKAIQIGQGATFEGRTGTNIATVSSNSFINISGIESYINASVATKYNQNVSGDHRWYISTGVPSVGGAISFSQAMTLDASGNLGIGETNPGNKLVVNGGITAINAATLGTTQTRPLLSFENPISRLYMGDGTGYSFIFSRRASSTTTNLLEIADAGNVVMGSAALATNATNGFFYVAGCAGTPTGTPTGYVGRVPIVVDTTNNKLYFYSGGAWRDAGP